MAAYTVAGIGIELFSVPWFIAAQREVAPAKLARVSSLDFLPVSFTASPPSASPSSPRHRRLPRQSGPRGLRGRLLRAAGRRRPHPERRHLFPDRRPKRHPLTVAANSIVPDQARDGPSALDHGGTLGLLAGQLQIVPLGAPPGVLPPGRASGSRPRPYSATAAASQWSRKGLQAPGPYMWVVRRHSAQGSSWPPSDRRICTASMAEHGVW
jgi:hypothetical protein